MKLEVSRRADLASRALVLLASEGRRMKAAELAAQIGTTPGFLSQVVTPLVGRGWIQSDPGPTGGYLATVAASTVSVLDVIEAVEGPTDTGQCVLEDRPCRGGGQCALHRPWGGALDHLLAELRSTPLIRAVAERDL